MTKLLFPAALLLGLLPRLAAAHAALDHAEPAVGSTVPKPPAEVRIWFDQSVDAGKSRIDVLDADGKACTTAAVRSDPNDDTVLVVAVGPITGKATVKWTAYATACEHTTSGHFGFTVGSSKPGLPGGTAKPK